MRFFAKLNDIVYRIEKFLAVILLGVMTLTLIAGVIFRYFLNAPLFWSDELAMFSFVWITFLGGSMAIKRQQLAAVTIFMDRFSGRTRRVLASISLGAVAAFCLSFLALSVSWILSPTISYETSDALQIPMFYPYLSVPVGICFMSVHALFFFIQSLRPGHKEGS